MAPITYQEREQIRFSDEMTKIKNEIMNQLRWDGEFWHPYIVGETYWGVKVGANGKIFEIPYEDVLERYKKDGIEGVMDIVKSKIFILHNLKLKE